MTRLVLSIDLAPGTDPDDVVAAINAESLCRLEEDDYAITGWEWKYPAEWLLALRATDAADGVPPCA